MKLQLPVPIRTYIFYISAEQNSKNKKLYFLYSRKFYIALCNVIQKTDKKNSNS